MASKTKFTTNRNVSVRTPATGRAPRTGKLVKRESPTGKFLHKGSQGERQVRAAGPAVEYETRNGKQYVVLPVTEFRRLQRAAAPNGDRPISPPQPPIAGAVDALAFADATIAQSIVRDRQAVRLTQRELAERAGIRVEVLNRAENGVVVPSVRTLTKIEEALVAAGLKRVPRR